MGTPLIKRIAWAAKNATPKSIKNLTRPMRQAMTLALVNRRMHDADKRLRPSFIIPGAMKAGTSALFEYLMAHPLVAEPLIKEIHYFIFNTARPPAWYFAHFPRRDEVPEGAITGEASPSYFAPGNLAPDIMKLLPDVKLVALFRDPVMRAISHYHHEVSVGHEKRPMDVALFDPRSVHWPNVIRKSRDDGYTGQRFMTYRPYVNHSYYDHMVENFSAFMEKGQMMIVRSEDMFENPRAIFDQVIAYLGLPPHDPGPLPPMFQGSYGETDPAIIERLKEIYAPHNERLYRLIGRDMGW